MDVDGSTQAPVQQQAAPAEKMLTVDQVNEIVKREKFLAAERARQEMQAQMVQQAQAPQAPMASEPNVPASGQANMDSLYQEVRGRLEKEFQEKQAQQEQVRQEQDAQKLAQQYFLSMGKGKELFDDFDEIMGDFKPEAFPRSVALATEMGGDQVPHIMRELANDPRKLAELEMLGSRSPEMAKKVLSGLIKSISTNEQARADNVAAPAPVNRLKSSMAGADTGAMTLRDLKKNPSLRG